MATTDQEATPRQMPWAKVPKWINEHNDLTDVDVRVYAAVAWAASPYRDVRLAATEIAEHRIGRPRHPSTVRSSLRRLQHVGAVTLQGGRGRIPIITIHESPLAVVERRLPQQKFALE